MSVSPGKILLDSMLKNPTFIKRGNYEYFVTPISNALPQLAPTVLMQISTDMLEMHPKEMKFNKVVAVETMGIPLGVVISQLSGKPLNLIRKTPYKIPGEVEFIQQTYYKTNKMYINGLSAKDSVLIVDDVIDSGGTMCEIINNVPKTGARIAGVLVAIERDKGIEKLYKALGKEALPFPVLALTTFHAGQKI